MSKEQANIIRCSPTTTCFFPDNIEWDSHRLLDPDKYGDITCVEGLNDLPDDIRDEVMAEISEILGGVTLLSIEKALARQVPCAWYAPGTSEIYVCLNHSDVLDTDAALAESANELEQQIDDNTGPVADAWRRIENLVADRLAQSTKNGN